MSGSSFQQRDQRLQSFCGFLIRGRREGIVNLYCQDNQYDFRNLSSRIKLNGSLINFLLNNFSIDILKINDAVFHKLMMNISTVKNPFRGIFFALGDGTSFQKITGNSDTGVGNLCQSGEIGRASCRERV